MQDETRVQPENLQVNEEIQDLPKEPEQTTKKGKPFFSPPTITELILLAGLILLYFLFFTSGKKQPVEIPLAFQKAGTKATSVVYVNLDTLNDKYEFIKKLKTDLESTGKKLQTELLSEQHAFEKEAAEFQKQVAANAISEEKAKIIYEQLMQKQQLLSEKKDRYTQQVADKELRLNMAVLDTVTNFLKRYNRTYKYDYILGLKTAGEILIANDTLDITKDVLKALNEAYLEKNK
jgi:outer membrane protein